MKKLISVVLAFALITCGVVYYTNENNAYAVSASSNEKQLLARAVNGEARGEPYEGQVAVAAVILNRVRHSSFPNTISGVIYQKRFSASTERTIAPPSFSSEAFELSLWSSRITSYFSF